MAGAQIYYFAIKFFFFFALVRALVRYEPLQGHALFLSALYTAAVAFLSFAFLLSPLPVIDWGGWGRWLARTFVLALVYFKLLSRFDEGFPFFALLVLGVGLVLF